MLIRGTAKKTFSSNRPIIARLILVEFIEGIGGWSTAALVEVYDRFGSQSFVSTLKVVGALVGIPPSEIDSMIIELGGEEKIVDVLRYPSSAGMEPSSGFLYLFQDDNLNIPAGEYSEDSLWQSGAVFVEVKQKSSWSGGVDWISGVPNLSWLGQWEERPAPQTALEAAYQGDFESYQDFLESEIALPPQSTKNPWLLPLLGIAGFLLIGGLKR